MYSTCSEKGCDLLSMSMHAYACQMHTTDDNHQEKVYQAIVFMAKHVYYVQSREYKYTIGIIGTMYTMLCLWHVSNGLFTRACRH
jgi:hypothetical protein